MTEQLVVISRDDLVTLIRSEVSKTVRFVLAEQKPVEDWIDIDGAAAILGWKREHTQRLASRGDIPSHRIGKVYRFKRSELDAFLSSRPAKRAKSA